ncbi:MAG: DNA modification methylase [Bacteroidetes bacterium]|nr:DNA modification methylase [Bacteroidota bacterium]
MAKKTVNQEMQIKTRKISDLIRAEYNPRELTKEQQNQLTDSLKRFGLVDPIIVNTHKDRKNILVGGHQRMKVWESMGNETIPTVEVNLNLEKEKELNVRLNKNTGQFDMELIQEHFETDDLIEWGFDADELEFFEPEVLEAEEDDFSVPDEIKTDIVLGDLIEIGEHRLLCGDSTCSDTVAKLMDGEKADMVFTDPPYKIQTEGGCKGNIGQGLRKQGKDIEFISDFNPQDFLQTLPLVFDNKKLNAYVFCNKELLPDYLVWARDSKYSFNVLIWKKPNAIPIGDSHRPDIEYLILFRKSAIWNNGLKDVNYSRCLEYGREKGLHPTMKPIELISNEMLISSNKGSLVFDFFLGSGSTMVAAHQLKRKCYGMELDPKYCQVIIDRMMKLDESLTVKINGKSYKK